MPRGKKRSLPDDSLSLKQIEMNQQMEAKRIAISEELERLKVLNAASLVSEGVNKDIDILTKSISL